MTIDIQRGESPNCRNSRNQGKNIDISTGEKNGYGKKSLREHKEKKRQWSRKYTCPKCKDSKMELYNFLSRKYKFICTVYVCNRCGDFFRKEECDLL